MKLILQIQTKNHPAKWKNNPRKQKKSHRSGMTFCSKSNKIVLNHEVALKANPYFDFAQHEFIKFVRGIAIATVKGKLKTNSEAAVQLI